MNEPNVVYEDDKTARTRIVAAHICFAAVVCSVVLRAGGLLHDRMELRRAFLQYQMARLIYALHSGSTPEDKSNGPIVEVPTDKAHRDAGKPWTNL